LFVRAQTEYLKGHWFEAETLLGQLLEEQDSDVDAQLMLATLYRRTRRVEDGQSKLKVLERMDGAEKWALEMAREREMLDRLE
jgi:cytochrome c-type biogenesis protein CcmH/NrfG